MYGVGKYHLKKQENDGKTIACRSGQALNHKNHHFEYPDNQEPIQNAPEPRATKAVSTLVETKIPIPKHNNQYVFLIAFIATIGGFLFGYDLSLIGAANSFLKDQFHLGEAALGFTTASAALGCVFGPFLGAWLCDRIGRERTMMVAAALLAVGALMTAFA